MKKKQIDRVARAIAGALGWAIMGDQNLVERSDSRSREFVSLAKAAIGAMPEPKPKKARKRLATAEASSAP